MSTQRPGLGVLFPMAIGFAAVLTACTTTTVDGWTVSCVGTDVDACRSIASLALNNMARSRPPEPTGVITVAARGRCFPVPDWADGSMCFDAHIPIGPAQELCLVIAGRPGLGGYGQVGGDEVSGNVNQPRRQVTCLG